MSNVRALMRFAFTIAMLLSVSLARAANTEAKAIRCDGPDTSTYYQTCVLSKNTKELDAELNARYQEIIRQYRGMGLNKERQMLIEAQRAWIRYRDKTCEFENQAIGGINAISWVRCENRLAGERLQYLVDFKI